MRYDDKKVSYVVSTSAIGIIVSLLAGLRKTAQPIFIQFDGQVADGPSR